MTSSRWGRCRVFVLSCLECLSRLPWVLRLLTTMPPVGRCIPQRGYWWRGGRTRGLSAPPGRSASDAAAIPVDRIARDAAGTNRKRATARLDKTLPESCSDRRRQRRRCAGRSSRLGHGFVGGHEHVIGVHEFPAKTFPTRVISHFSYRSRIQRDGRYGQRLHCAV